MEPKTSEFSTRFIRPPVNMPWGEVGRILIVWFPVPSFCVISMFVCRAMISMAKILDLQDMNYMNPCKSLGRFNPLPINVRRHMAFQNISATSAYHSMFLPHSTWFSSNTNPLVGPLVAWVRKEMKTVAYYIKMCLFKMFYISLRCERDLWVFRFIYRTKKYIICSMHA